MRVICYCLTFLGAFATAVGAQPKPLLTVNFRGDTVEYDQQSGELKVTGNVNISAASDRPGTPTVSMAASEIAGNLRSGVLTASQGVRLLSQQFAIRGQRVDFSFTTDEFTVDKGALEADAPSEDFPGRILRGFFFGDTIKREGDVLYVIRARLTTCDRAEPHYSIGSGEITYDTRSRLLTVRHPRMQLYGLKLSLPGTYQFGFGRRGRGGEFHLPLPGYSSFDGLYTTLQRSLTRPDDDWQLSAAVRIGTRWQFPGEILAEHEGDDDLWTVEATRLEQVTYDLDKAARLSRLPEIIYSRHLQQQSAGLSRLDLTLFAGRVHERVRDLPETKAARAGFSLDYTPLPWQREARRGLWWAAGYDQTFYDTGDRLRDLNLEFGTGWRFGDSLGASAWAVHHFTSGSTPFFFDDIYVEDELFTAFDARLNRKWSVAALGHWDLDEGELRDYTVSVSRRNHCLTWRLGYNYAQQQIALGLDINGLTGDTEPPVTAPLVAPDEVPPLPPMVPAVPARASPSPAPAGH